PGTGSKSLYNLSSRQQKLLLAFLNSSVAAYYLKLLSPTLNFEAGDVGKLPILEASEFDLTTVDKLIYISQSDWNSHERSVGF
ncbi:hypothetical protein, partial [Vibrio parahaemolyticus]